MFALCFTSAAAADLRRAQVQKSTRKSTNPALKAARTGLAVLAIILAAAGTSQAGKWGGGGNSGGSRSNSSFRVSNNGSSNKSFNLSNKNFSQSVKTFNQSTPKFNKLNTTPKLNNNFNTNTLTNRRVLNGNNNLGVTKNIVPKTPIKLNVQTNGQKLNHLPQTGKINTKIGGLPGVVNKHPTILNGKIGGLNNVVNKNNPTINRKINGIGDVLNKANPTIKTKIPGLIQKINGNGNGHGHDGNHGTGKGIICGTGKGKCHNWDWCWKHHCKPCYKPCHQDWHCWKYPKWCGLYRHTCGYYVNVPVVVVHGIDLQLLAIRFVDNGDPAQNLGPRFRVWIRNNTPTPMLKPFNVLALAARDVVPSTELPQAGVRIEAMQPGQILPVDIRLPVQANDASLGMIHVLVDSHREVPEVFEDNNGIVLPRSEVMSVDPALLTADVQTAVPGSEINIAGEGLGIEVGQVIVKLGGLDLAGEVIGWSEFGIQIRLPAVQIVNPVDAQIIAIRADGKAIPPLPLKVIPGVAQISAQPAGVQPAAAIETSAQPTAVQAMFGG